MIQDRSRRRRAQAQAAHEREMAAAIWADSSSEEEPDPADGPPTATIQTGAGPPVAPGASPGTAVDADVLGARGGINTPIAVDGPGETGWCIYSI